MFERYTEKARRVIFFARYEASSHGSPEIECEHLLLGMLRESDLVHETLGFDVASAVRREIEETYPLAPQISTSVDMPLSHLSQRVLSYGAEEAERLNHRIIEVGHLLAGLLRESESFATQVLNRHGLTLDQVRLTMQQRPSTAGDRPSLHATIDALPDDLLQHATACLNTLIYRRSTSGFSGNLEQQTTPSQSSGSSTWTTNGGLRHTGSSSSGWTELDGTHASESRRFFEGHEIILTERLKLDEDSKTLLYTQELAGPKHKETRTVRFDLS